MLILPTELLEANEPFPHDPSYFEEQVAEICTKSRQVLIKEWLPMCADILLKYKDTWKRIIPKKQGDTLANMERFFGTVNALLARQLRLLVVRSLQHFLAFMEKFEVSLVRIRNVHKSYIILDRKEMILGMNIMIWHLFNYQF